MPKNYTQLTLEQRYVIESYHKIGMRQYQIAKEVGVSASTISRELKRNIPKRGKGSKEYVASKAQKNTMARHTYKHKCVKFSMEMKEQIRHYLTVERWSPELISKKVEFAGGVRISHEWIYQWIWSCKHGNRKEERAHKKLYIYLRHGKRRRKRGKRHDSRGLIPNRVPIEQRPTIVSKRQRLGDIEVDLMMGKNHKGALLVMTDRSTLHTRLVKLDSKNSTGIEEAMIRLLSSSRYRIRTLTFDNDKAFSNHQQIGKSLKARTYFTRPYTSQDKGTVENRIGIIRRFFPKKTDLTFVTEKDVQDVEDKLNNRPVRKFKYLTPNQVLLKKIALIT